MYKQFRNTKYEVSEEGKIRRIDTKKEIKTFYKNGKKGNYLKVNIYDNGKRKIYSVHRMILETFTYRDDTKEINHKNLKKDDNRLCNLEYCTREENIEHAFKMSKKISQRKELICVNKETHKLLEFRSIYQAGKYFSKNKDENEYKKKSSNIISAITGQNKSAYGYYWWYKEDFNYDDIEGMIKSREPQPKYTEEQLKLINKNKLNDIIIKYRMEAWGMSLDEVIKYKKNYVLKKVQTSFVNPKSKCSMGLNKRFGNLIVTDIIREKNKKPYYLCQCDCGKKFKTQYTNVIKGYTKSCGCKKLVDKKKKI